MERLFSPCTRMHDLLESRGLVLQVELQELNLDGSTEELLSAERAFTYADLYAVLRNENRNTVAWLTPHAAVFRECNSVRYSVRYIRRHLDGSCRFSFYVDSTYVFVLALSPEHLLEICDVVVRLLAASTVQSVFLHNWDRKTRLGALINAPTFAYLMEQCQSLKVLTLESMALDENHCRILGAYSRPGLEIELFRCKLTSSGTSALAEVLGRNQGPTNLDYCHIDNSILVNGLRGNSRLKIFRPRIPDDDDDCNRQVLAISSALKDNKGLVKLDLRYASRLSNETWDAVCDSLKTHPTLQVLDLRYAEIPLSQAVLKSRIQKLVDMMKVNISIRAIRLDDHYRQHEIFRESVIPYLETNRFRPRLLAIQKTRPMPYRAKVLGRALLAARTNVNRFWMLLSGSCFSVNRNINDNDSDGHAGCESSNACYYRRYCSRY